jgi:hypothetical protein
MTSNDAVIVSEANYAYQPLIFEYFMRGGTEVATHITGTYTFSNTALLKPRGQPPQLRLADNTLCP